MVHTKTSTRLPAKQKIEKSNPKTSIRSECGPKKQGNQIRDNKLETAHVPKNERLHLKSCPRSQSKQRSKYESSSVVSNESIHSESCPMKSQTKQKNIRHYSSSLSSDESIHSIYCPMRSKQQKCELHASRGYSHSESCPISTIPKQKKGRHFQTSYLYSETYPVRLQRNLKYHTSTSEDSIHSVSCPMRSVAKQNREKGRPVSRISERYSESRKLRLSAYEKTEGKYQTSRAKV